MVIAGITAMEDTSMTDTIPQNAIDFSLKRELADLPRVSHGQKLIIDGRDATAGTVVGYAQSYGECPVAALERATAAGHEIRWINLDAVAITAWKQTPVERLPLSTGDLIWLDGCLCRIEGRANKNFAPVPLTADERREVYQKIA